MAAQDPGKGKGTGQNYSGGSPADFGCLKTDSEPEFAGVHKAGPNVALKAEGGNSDNRSGSEESRNSTGFNLHSKAYQGPENWVPENVGVVNPDDITHTG